MELLGDDGPGADDGDVPVLVRRLDGSPLAAVVRLCLLQLPVSREELAGALGPEALGALAKLGLVVADGPAIVPRARIVPSRGLLLAFDGFARGADDPPGYVAPFTPTASWLAALTPRRRVGRALDVGTGNGVHALLAAAHASSVVATDVNPRALAFTQINAALNGLSNVETRLGSLFEPAAGERFDLVTCNAPYVVSPESRWQYRDGGLPADEFSRQVVQQAAAALADGGFASTLVSWLAPNEDGADDALESWLAGCGCDAWVLSLEGSEPLEHAAGWNEHLSSDPAAFGAALDDWSSYFARLGVGWISEGAVLLHRRDGATNALRIDNADSDDLEDAGPQIERVFASLARLESMSERAEVLDAVVVLAASARVERSRPARSDDVETTLTLEEGTLVSFELDPDVAEVVEELDGKRTLRRALGRVVAEYELDADEADELREDTLDEIEDLLGLGLAELR